MADPKLSIIIPSHDTCAFTLCCLASLAGAGGDDPQLILVDDGSSDGTAAAVTREFPGVQVIRNPGALGFTRAVNRGLAVARGEIVMLLNADTEVDPGALDRLLTAFSANSRLGVAGGTLRYADGSPQWSGGPEPGLGWFLGSASGLPAWLGQRPGYRRRVKPLATGKVDWVSGAALAFRRSAVARPLDESFELYAQDLELCLRIADAGHEVAILPEVGVLHHQGVTIGRQAEASSGRQNLARLWPDLLRWASQRHGTVWARRAAWSLRVGGGLRWLALCLATVFGGQAQRAARRRDRAAVAAGLSAIGRWRQDDATGAARAAVPIPTGASPARVGSPNASASAGRGN